MARARSLLSVDLRRLWLNPGLTLPDNSPIDLRLLSGQPSLRGVAKMSADREVLADELPAASPELVLVRVAIEAYLASAHLKPRDRARAFVKTATSILADEESVALAFPIRPATHHEATAKARRGAIALWKHLLPTFMARLPKRDI